jgi:hypothetical protein
MRRRLATLAAVVLACSGPFAVAGAAAAGTHAGPAGRIAPGGASGPGRAVAGPAVKNLPSVIGTDLSPSAEAYSVSCASPGNCSAGGAYTDGLGRIQPFVVTETSGTWGTAQEVPGIAALNTYGEAWIFNVSCTSAGNCGASGDYEPAQENLEPFVVTETNGTWGTAQEIPGIAALNGDDDASVTSVSCSSPGNCSAGGWYGDSSGGQRAFVVTETSGTWGTAEEVPGTAALNSGDTAQVLSVSCGSAGNCSAGGFYADTPGTTQAFVVTETSGTWGTAQEVPGTAALNSGGQAQVNSVSCASPGNCSAGGFYTEAAEGDQQAFVVTETSGTWGTAEEVPGTATLNTGGQAQVNSVSCASPGDCSAGGTYSGGSIPQAFVVTESNGTWGTAEEVTGIATHTHYDEQVISVSCGSAGNCSVAGYYSVGISGQQVFIANQTNGTWGAAAAVPGTAALNAGSAQVTSVSCASAGNCGVAGVFTADDGNGQAFIAGEANGTWGRAGEVPGLAALNGGALAQVTSVSCASAGTCVAGGQDADSSGLGQAFVAAEANSTWGTAQNIPGLAALNTGGRAQVNAVSCTSAGNCSVGGFFVDSTGNQHGFVATETNGTWGTAQESPGANLNADGYAQVTSISCASAGNCSAGGQYADRSGNGQAFVANETNGVWATGRKVSGSAFNAGGHAVVTSVSCASAGDCSAGGSYLDASGLQQVFVVNETNGVWGTAQEVPGTATLNAGGYAEVTSVSCASAGNCSAGGYYFDNVEGYTHNYPFVVNETNGTWGTATQVTGTGEGQVNAVSCGSAGNCSAGGYYHGPNEPRAFVAAEKNGTWGAEIQVPGSRIFRLGHAGVDAMSCTSAGNCSASGYYTDKYGNIQAFAVTKTNGSWKTAVEVPGIGALNTGGYAQATSVSCASAGNCSAGGYYFDSSPHRQAFVVSQANGVWASAEQIPGTAVPGSPSGK